MIPSEFMKFEGWNILKLLDLLIQLKDWFRMKLHIEW